MLTSVLKVKWIMRLMVLIYLLLSFGTANASFWCHTDENSTHLESNPVGKCWTNCQPGSGNFQQGVTVPEAAGFSSGPGDDCFDSPVFTSTLTSSTPISSLNKKLASPFSTANLPHIFELNLEIVRLVRHNRTLRLPESQTLKVLRTVVLLR